MTKKTTSRRAAKGKTAPVEAGSSQREWPAVFDKALRELARLTTELSVTVNGVHQTGSEEARAAAALATQGLLALQWLTGGNVLDDGHKERLVGAAAAVSDAPAYRAWGLELALNSARLAYDAGELATADLEWVVVAARRHANQDAQWSPMTEADQRIAREAVEAWTISRGGTKDRGNKTTAYVALHKHFGGETFSDHADMKKFRRTAKRVKRRS